MVQRRLRLLVLVAVILVGGVSAATADDLRKIVTFVDGTLLAVQQQVVALSGSTVLHTLSLITALAVLTDEQGLAILQSKVQGVCNPSLDALCVVAGIFDDTVAMVDGGTWPICIAPAAPPVPESYPWGQQHIGVPAVHPQWQGSGVTVAILDTGIDSLHSELSPRIVNGYNARAGENASDYQDYNGHGTHMAGIIAANRKNPFPGPTGIVGTAPQATFLAVKVLDQYGAGYLSDVINGLQWVHNNGSPLAKLINMSVGFSNDSDTDFSANGHPLKKATQKLDQSGVIMVASAGNQCAQDPSQDEGGGANCQGPALTCDPSQTAVKYPAAYSWVLAVVATDVNDLVTAYSLSGSQVDVWAPGGSKATGMRILSTNKGNGYGWGSGTSQAAAHVTGAVALALQKKPQQSFTEVRSLLQTTATPQGVGLINVYNMLQALP
jgi:subtilisin family serine protease